ncbi:DUF554 domain-containing protein [Liquorilactobacillus mali]|uniref:Transport protein n=1 Tax=Liquorilactobacillus mali KCTC 3596 = DSM 20444 TaxID=1046596 RepID=J1F564_9LACO|nr:DUF554 domain-containing protein [Liquorilactobacillus mali]EJF01270.1 hypothetical protein LMA_01689 [Liquorilactobacillus mali KCTC 3596 = DSM 20444]KRN08596.1 hypothetical protein FD00_GL002154 [Liquorilactobacillus mali KCTC 3596 = DSM 20444]MDC7952796.1 DUF554 domain-containing protein [Liquorilactobacillus mali]QFQ75418.1 DUF554 domain-containing protein [Liquorilactobacillus mali]
MVGIGALVNASTVAVGGIVGYLFQRVIPIKVQKTVLQAIGLGIIFIGFSGTLSKMLVIKSNSISTIGTIMLIVTLAVGTIVGELIDINTWLNSLGKTLSQYFGKEENLRFSEGFIISTLTVCIGAMGVVGALQDGLNHDPSILFTKSIIDFIVILLFAATYGIGCSLAAIPILIFEGSITLLATFINPFLTSDMLTGISLVGNTLIALIGINMLLGAKIKIANLLPSLLIVIIYVHFWGLS